MVLSQVRRESDPHMCIVHDLFPSSLIHEQVILMLGKADNTVRDGCTAADIEVYRYDDMDDIQRLIHMGIVRKKANSITIITLSSVIKLCRGYAGRKGGDLRASELCIQLRHISSTSTAPPPNRLQPGFAPPAPGFPATPSLPLLSRQGGEASLAPSSAADPPSTVQQQPFLESAYHLMEFPSTLPKLYLSPEDMKAPYALSSVSTSLQAEILRFKQWSSAPINTERSSRFVCDIFVTSNIRNNFQVMIFNNCL